jgi:type I restriction enzyme, S subunit
MSQSDWVTSTLGQVTIWKSGGTPSKNELSYWNGDIPWISASSMKSNRLMDSDLKITKAGLENGSRLADQGSVLILVRGSELHKRIPIGIAKRPVAFNQDVKALKAKDGLIPEYLLYWLLANESLLLSKVEYTGIGAGKLDTELIKGLPFCYSDIPEQRAIVHILSMLDDKIELNRHMNETLESIVHAIFKSWFIDFDPVHAKVEGYDTGLPREVTNIFPNNFEDSELGIIPKGWRVITLSEAIDVNPKRMLGHGKIAPYLDMANMPIRGHSPDTVGERPFSSGMRFTNGDTLLARITPCLENGKTAYVDFLDDGQVGWGSTEYIVLRPKPPLPTEYAYCLARSAEFRQFVIQSMTGSSGRQRVPTESLSQYMIVLPSEPVAELFGKLVKPIFSRTRAAIMENSTLSALRDSLLPRLISGELRVPDAKRFVNEAFP